MPARRRHVDPWPSANNCDRHAAADRSDPSARRAISSTARLANSAAETLLVDNNHDMREVVAWAVVRCSVVAVVVVVVEVAPFPARTRSKVVSIANAGSWVRVNDSSCTILTTVSVILHPNTTHTRTRAKDTRVAGAGRWDGKGTTKRTSPRTSTSTAPTTSHIVVAADI